MQLGADGKFIEHLKSILGDDAEITIEYVTGIPFLAFGKFKKLYACSSSAQVDEKCKLLRYAG